MILPKSAVIDGFASESVVMRLVKLFNYLVIACLLQQTLAVRAEGDNSLATEKRDVYYLIVDKSGSVFNSRIHLDVLISKAVSNAVERLSPSTELNVVLFGSTTGPRWSQALMSPRNKTEFYKWFNEKYKSGGKTLLYETVAGIFEEVWQKKDQYRRIDIDVLTDGDDTNDSSLYKNWSSVEAKLPDHDWIEKKKTVGELGISWVVLGQTSVKAPPSEGSFIELTTVTHPEQEPILLGPKPKANFQFNPSVAETDQKILFALNSSVGITNVIWNFGDGSPALSKSDMAPLSYNYKGAGEYTVTAKVAGFAGQDEFRDKVSVRKSVPLTAKFESQPQARIKERVIFSDESLGSPDTWIWSVNDEVITNRTLTYTFATSGVYSVSLTVKKDSKAAPSLTKTVRVLDPIPLKASFNPPKEVRVGVSKRFIDQSEGMPATWHWSFGGQGESRDRHPEFTFETAGQLTIRLVVTDADQKRADTNEQVLVVLSRPPLEASFRVEKTVQVGKDVTPYDTSKGNPTAWHWKVNGQKDSNEQHPTFVFQTPGEVEIKLTVTHKDGRTSTFEQKIIVLPPPPDAKFTLSASRFLIGQAVEMHAVHPHIEAEHGWQIEGISLANGKGKNAAAWTPKRAGAHTIIHTVKNAGGETSAEKTIVVASQLKASFDIVTPPKQWRSGTSISFGDNSQGDITNRTWTFGDGSAPVRGNEKVVAHTYDTSIATNYTVVLTVNGPDGEQRASKDIKIIPGLLPAFSLNRTKGQLPLRNRPFVVKAINLTPSGEHTYYWDFGDGTTSRERDPEHAYTAVSNYIVRLKVIDSLSGIERFAPDVTVNALPNTQFYDALVQTAVLAVVMLIAWIIWFFFRKPWPKKEYRLGEGKLSGNVLRIGGDRYAWRARHEIPLPVSSSFFGDFAELRSRNSGANTTWELSSGPNAEKNLSVSYRGQTTVLRGRTSFVLQVDSLINMGCWQYSFERDSKTKQHILKRTFQPDQVVFILSLLLTLLIVLIPILVLLANFYN